MQNVLILSIIHSLFLVTLLSVSMGKLSELSEHNPSLEPSVGGIIASDTSSLGPVRMNALARTAALGFLCK
jgi:hypothetical protein